MDGNCDWSEEQIVLISAIEHFSYCPRQCALIHVEQTYDENVFTVRGNIAHERVHSGEETTTQGFRIVRGIPLWSERLGIRGKADMVEMRPDGPFPVEYKVGRRKGRHADVQLCAQALCLEEMLGTAVPSGAVFYHDSQRRIEIILDAGVRERTLTVISSIREMLLTQKLPEVLNDSRCRNCSLLEACLPSVIGEPDRLRGLQSTLFQPFKLGET